MRLLIVEDEKSLVRALTAILEKKGYSVDAVFDGESALEYLKNGSYDGVILDVMLPELDGFEVLKRMRGEKNLTPVLMLTARSEVDDKVLGLDSGANDYLTKPFAIEELLARIRAMTRTRTQAADVILKVGNITLNQTDHKLSSPGGSFDLTNKEFQIMEMLMVHPRQLVTTGQLFEKIWGYDGEAEISVVWVYISYLRKKLKSIQADVKIKVKRKTGYFLEVQNDEKTSNKIYNAGNRSGGDCTGGNGIHHKPDELSECGS